ncbi:MAG: (d)CMP kinase [Bacilli bacterium]|jgi:cytidylate kinase|nr:(d)CMP kinase [Bacilli bacterium]
MIYSVAIDGPSGSGKSTIADRLAKRLGLVHIDTGAMYRAVTLLALEKGIDPKNEVKVDALLDDCVIELTVEGKVFLNGEDVTTKIRSNEVSDAVSYVSTYKQVREFLVAKQREMSKSLSVVMDGRDIGTVVLPNADVKIYQVASVEKRAERRFKENTEKGLSTSYEDCLNNLKKRDLIDSSRAISPLRPASDSIIIDTSDLSIDEVVSECEKIIAEQLKEKNIK